MTNQFCNLLIKLSVDGFVVSSHIQCITGFVISVLQYLRSNTKKYFKYSYSKYESIKHTVYCISPLNDEKIYF